MNEKLILIVDDELDICREISGYLSTKGYKVICAGDGMDGVKMFQQHKPILVLTDYKMPVMNGIELLKAVKSTNKDIHVVLISGAADTKIIVEAMKDDAFDFLLKPVDLPHLLDIVKTAISKTKAVMTQDKVRRASVNFINNITDVGGDITALYFTADLDEHTVNKYEMYVKQLLEEHSIKQSVVLVLKHVRYINNIGLNFLINLKDLLRQRGFGLFLCELSQQVDFYLRSLGYIDFFTVGRTLEHVKEIVRGKKE
jgi:anti-anti-sigma factor